jgi:hypothetical protein
LDWFRGDRVWLAGGALLAGVLLGGLVTLALGWDTTPTKTIPQRSAAEAIASDRAAAPTPTPTATPTAAPKREAAKPARRKAARRAAAPAGAPEPVASATPTPDDRERGDDAPVTQRAPAPAPRRIVSRQKPAAIAPKPTTPKATPAPRSTPAPTPAPAQAAPQPTSAPPPASTPTRPPNRPPHGGGGGDDDDPG